MTFRCKPEYGCMWFNVTTIHLKLAASTAYGINTTLLGRVSRPSFYFPSYCVIDTRILVPISTSLVCIQCYHNLILRRLNRGSECNIFQAPFWISSTPVRSKLRFINITVNINYVLKLLLIQNLASLGLRTGSDQTLGTRQFKRILKFK